MEEIKTNFEKIMEQFSDGIAHNAPKRLSFDKMHDSFEAQIPKKRKRSAENGLGSSGMIQNSEDSDKNDSTYSLNSSLKSVSSPWESRRIKVDLLEAQSRISKLKLEIENQHSVRSQMEILYNTKISALEEQCEFSSKKVLDLEKHLTQLRKRERITKSELLKAQTQLTEQKKEQEDLISFLKRTNKELEENLRFTKNKLIEDVNEYKGAAEKLEMDLDLTTQELERTQEILSTYKDKAAGYDRIKSEIEIEMHSHAQAKSKIKELEYQISSYEEWKELSKTTQHRLSTLPDLEKEITKLRQDNKNWRETLGNKLLLEEQVFDLKSRLEKYENSSVDLHALKMQTISFEKELTDWKQLAADHCTPNTPLTPISLRSRIEQILQKDLILSSEKGTTKNEKDVIQTQLNELQVQNEIYTKANNDLKTSLKHHKTIILRVQKKLMLVAKERDCYKGLLESYEKDLTISGALSDTLNPDIQLKARIEMLEKTLCGYKDMCGSLKKELSNMLPQVDLPLEMPLNTESYDRLRKEIETLRIENDRLKHRKEELELEMEHRCLKGDFNVDKFKIVHMEMNPAAEAYENTKNEIEKLQAEIERLKRRNRKLEEDNEEMTTRMNETSNLTVNVKELNVLRSQLESTQAKFQHMKEIFKATKNEYRDVVYMLFGYRLDRLSGGYRISSMYADNEREYLNFRLNESGVLDMLETEYSVSLNEMMRTLLGQHNSLPAFLSTLTLELFKRT